MNRHENWMWLPILALATGGIPLAIADFPEGGWNGRIAAGIFSSIVLMIYAALKRAGDKFPSIRQWTERSLVGASLLLFVFALLASTGSVLFANLPLPQWLHVSVAVLLASFALALLINSFRQDHRA